MVPPPFPMRHKLCVSHPLGASGYLQVSSHQLNEVVKLNKLHTDFTIPECRVAGCLDNTLAHLCLIEFRTRFVAK